jgi:transcriptional regulator with XRE-family HTH domain
MVHVMIDDKKLKTIISEKLRNLMEKRGESEISISHGTGISQSAVNRIKNGLVCPSLFQTIKITDYFNITLQEFINENKIANKENDEKYIPVINSSDLIKNGEKNIEGFAILDNTTYVNVIGFKFDNSFSCKLLNKDAIIIARSITINSVTNGNTLLFIDKDNYKIGNYINGVIKPIDNFAQSFDIKQIRIIGMVVKIENKYIRNKSIIQKIIDKMGEKKLNSFIEKSLAFT